MERNEDICGILTRPVASITSDENRSCLFMVKSALSNSPVLSSNDEINALVSSNGEVASLSLTGTCLNHTDEFENFHAEGIEEVGNCKAGDFRISPAQTNGDLFQSQPDSIIMFNRSITSEEDLDDRRESMKSRKSFRSLKLNRNKTKAIQRSDSLPVSFANLSVTDFTSAVCMNKNASEQETSVFSTRAAVVERSTAHLNTSSLVAVTPPPSYRSLIKQTLADVPPSYESVTGLSLNIGQDPATVSGKSNSRSRGSRVLQPQSKILIVIIISMVILTTVILVLAEAFTTM